MLQIHELSDVEHLAAQGDAPVIILQSLRAFCHNPKMRPSSFSTSDSTRTCRLEITLRGKGKGSPLFLQKIGYFPSNSCKQPLLESWRRFRLSIVRIIVNSEKEDGEIVVAANTSEAIHSDDFGFTSDYTL